MQPSLSTANTAVWHVVHNATKKGARPTEVVSRHMVGLLSYCCLGGAMVTPVVPTGVTVAAGAAAVRPEFGPHFAI